MPRRLVYTAQVRRDVAGIAAYIFQAADAQTAGNVVLRLRQRCETLINAPGSGAPYLPKAGVRKVIEGPYKIFYRVTDAHVIILRIWDGRRGTEPGLP